MTTLIATHVSNGRWAYAQPLRFPARLMSPQSRVDGCYRRQPYLITTGEAVITMNENITQSGYTPCACRDCMDTTVSSDISKPELCTECKDAGCVAIAPYNEGVQFCTTYECQRNDAYGEC